MKHAVSAVIMILVLAAALVFIAATPAVGADAAAGEGGGLVEQIKFVWQKFQEGGRTMYPIAACSIVTLAFTVERLLSLRRARIAPRGLSDRARELWKQGNYDAIIAECRSQPSVLGDMIAFMVQYRDRPLDEIREDIDGIGTEGMRPHYRRPYWMNVSATVAPLLGLFGTVVGMVDAFDSFRLLGETGDPGVFAASIAIALITTVGGLVVAIPSLTLYHFFKSRANTMADELEAEVRKLTLAWFKPATAPSAMPVGAGV